MASGVLAKLTDLDDDELKNAELAAVWGKRGKLFDECLAEALRNDPDAAELQALRRNASAEKRKLLLSMVLRLPKGRFEALRKDLQDGKVEDKIFARELTGAYVGCFSSRKDRAALVDFLASQCPRHVGPYGLEEYLARPGNKLYKDAALIFAESYRRSTNPRAKKTLLEILGDSFPSLRDEHENDDTFVKACETWYKKNESKIIYNDRYLVPQSPPLEELYVIRE